MGNTGQQVGRRWQVATRTMPNLIDQLLANRGITDRERFFHPDYERDSHDPALMPNMAIALERITAAIEAKEIVAVYGDYDADGIPGTALLVQILEANGLAPIAYIPDREKEGYGLNQSAIDALQDQGATLLITVDLGITNYEQVAYAASRGLDVIVTDHHEIDPERLPQAALAIVHPRLPGSKYPFGELAGGGVAWKLGQAIAAKTGMPTSSQLKWLLELPSISTVCDIVPLVDENRMIVYYGLKVLAQTRNFGLRAIYKTGGITPDLVNERTVGFQIGPRLNAPGRIDHASLSLQLLRTKDASEASQLAAKVEEHNQERQAMLERIIVEAIEAVEAGNLAEQPALVLVGEDWSPGVIGLAASRLVERFHRPTILLGRSNGLLKGSGRSIERFNLLAGIAANKDLLASYGGHEKAAGLALEVAQFEAFRTAFLKFAEAQLTADDLVPTSRVDAVLAPGEVTDELVTDLLRFAPYGPGNRKPVFAVGPLTVAEVRTVGATGAHAKLRFTEQSLDGIAFGLGGRVKEFGVGSQVAVLASLEFNSWNGNERIQLSVTDVKSWDHARRELAV